MSPRAVWALTVLGWVLFTVSAIAFLVAALSDGGPVEVIASLAFLVACIVFLIPVVANRPHR